MFFLAAEQQNKDIPDHVQMMTHKMTDIEKTLSVQSTVQIPRLKENVTAAFSRVCSTYN